MLHIMQLNLIDTPTDSSRNTLTDAPTDAQTDVPRDVSPNTLKVAATGTPRNTLTDTPTDAWQVPDRETDSLSDWETTK